MLDVNQFREYVLRPALDAVGLNSDAAENLLIGTAIQESRLKYLHQIRGPALGVYQMEPATYADIWKNYIAYKDDLRERICCAIGFKRFEVPEADRLIWDLRYATIMTRVHYLRVPEALPKADNVHGLAAYWKQHYNTYLGRGTPEQFVQAYDMLDGGLA